MVFVEAVADGVGLVFKPEKNAGYRGEPLDKIGFAEGAIIPQVTWDPKNLTVASVKRIGPATL